MAWPGSPGSWCSGSAGPGSTPGWAVGGRPARCTSGWCWTPGEMGRPVTTGGCHGHHRSPGARGALRHRQMEWLNVILSYLGCWGWRCLSWWAPGCSPPCTCTHPRQRWSGCPAPAGRACRRRPSSEDTSVQVYTVYKFLLYTCRVGLLVHFH